MKKLFLLLLLPIMSFGQGYGDCVSGNCENGYGTWHSHKTIKNYNNVNDLIERSETQYTGTFKNGKFHGLGTMEFWYYDEDDVLFNTYEGSFVSGKINGYCVSTKSGPYGDFWQFFGQYKDDERNGIGVFYEGSYGTIQETGYTGYWVNGKFIKKIAEF